MPPDDFPPGPFGVRDMDTTARFTMSDLTPGVEQIHPRDWQGRWPGSIPYKGRHSDRPPAFAADPATSGLLAALHPEE